MNADNKKAHLLRFFITLQPDSPCAFNTNLTDIFVTITTLGLILFVIRIVAVVHTSFE